MTRSVTALIGAVLLVAAGTSACTRPSPAAEGVATQPALPQADGTLVTAGLSAPVTVVRDRWGVPHITASTTADLFFAQGFIQAQDRLFQMDLWRRASLGRLAEVLGANFVQRDAMTRRMQYRGSIDVEWSAYPPDTRATVTAFSQGVNAWIDHSRGAWPEEFRLAGWTPEHWRPEDLLNRTDAFVASAGVRDEVFRARLAAVIGAEDAGAAFGASVARGQVPAGVDLSAITEALGETVLRAGARPFFVGFAAPYRGSSDARAPIGESSVPVAPSVSQPYRRLDAPSPRYLVHLSAPGWNVAGATAPWLPGVAIGHNDHLAWDMTLASPDVQDIYVEHVNPENSRQVRIGDRWVDMTVEKDVFPVKGRPEGFEFERQYTAHGVVIGVDRERHLAYALRWSGFEPGAAAELPALALDRATTMDEFETALGAWRAPVVDVVVAARGGEMRSTRAGLEPLRRGFDGRFPQDGRHGTREWVGWQERRALATIPHDSVGRVGRLLSLLEAVTLVDPSLGEARRRLLAWNRQMRLDSEEARLYVAWEQALRFGVARSAVPAPFVDGVAGRLLSSDIFALPAFAGRGRAAVTARDRLIADTFQVAVDEVSTPQSLTAWQAAHQVTFEHPLALSAAAKARWNVGPVTMVGDVDMRPSRSADGGVPPALGPMLEAGDWEQSPALSAPGQSGWPDSPHYKDLASMWAAGEMLPLAFTAEAVRRAATQTLTLQPVSVR